MSPILEKLTEVVISGAVIPVFGGTASINTGDTHLRSEAQPIFGRGPGVSGIQRSTISGLIIEMAGSGTAGTAPGIDALYEMCALGGTNDPGVSEIYAHDAAVTSVAATIGVFQGDTIQQDLVSGAGNMVITGTPGIPLMLSFDLQGIWTAPTEDTNATTLAPDADAPIFKASTMTLASDSLVWRSFGLNLNNEVAERPDASATEGIAPPLITNFNHRITLVAEVPDAFSTANYWTTWQAATKMAFSMVVGGTAGNIITITADVYHAAAPVMSWENGIEIVTLDLEVSELAADSQLAIAFT